MPAPFFRNLSQILRRSRVDRLARTRMPRQIQTRRSPYPRPSLLVTPPVGSPLRVPATTTSRQSQAVGGGVTHQESRRVTHQAEYDTVPSSCDPTGEVRQISATRCATDFRLLGTHGRSTME